jgi:NhaA family Na+:H+ antiporter
MPLSRLREFLRLEAAGGIVLMIAALAALVVANSPLGRLYLDFLEIPGSVQVGALVIAKPLLLWVNDLWMAVFFFLVGLEIKREVREGQLSTRADIALPAAAALGGMIVPGLVYAVINLGSPFNLKGWAIPTATDIAFALGILALLGRRAPMSLKVLLTAAASSGSVCSSQACMRPLRASSPLSRFRSPQRTIPAARCWRSSSTCCIRGWRS